MATNVKPCGCSCSGMTAACDCTGIGCTLVCESKAVEASLCGFAEFTDPSDPPKYYRKKAAGGAYHIRTDSGTPCTGAIADTEIVWSGDYVFDKDTCAETNGMEVRVNGGAPSPLDKFITADGVLDGTSYALTPTESSGEGTGACINHGIGGWGSQTGSQSVELSQEDTEHDAEKRAADVIVDWTSCACSTCTAFRTDRSGGGEAGFSSRVVQTKAQWPAVIGKTYTVTIKFAERPLGSGGDFIFFGMIHESTVTADSGSEETDWVDVPNAAGRETIVLSALAVILA